MTDKEIIKSLECCLKQMRNILFRGKRKDNLEWVEGYYIYAAIKTKDKLCIDDFIKKHWLITTNDNVYEVIPETVGECTSLLDKNGKKIFEGDILYDEYNDSNCLIEFEEGSFCFVDDNICQSVWGCSMLGFEVIGNIHDNPELLSEVQK